VVGADKSRASTSHFVDLRICLIMEEEEDMM
jgi:hypothetical protein